MAKKVSENTFTEDACINAVSEFCRKNKLLFKGEPRKDFGVDCLIEVVEANHALNFVVGVQCKSGKSYKKNVKRDKFEIYLDEDDKSYWLGANYPIFYMYFDLDNGKLYYKHIQYFFDNQEKIDEVKKINFSKDDLVDKGFSQYLKNLAKKTPNPIDRHNISLAKNIEWLIDNNLMVGKNYSDLANIRNIFTRDETRDMGWWFPYFSQILGYSKNNKWVFYFDSEVLRQKCSNVYGTFLNIEDWKIKKFEIMSEKDYDECVNNYFPQEELEKRIKPINQQIKKLGIEPAITLKTSFDFKPDSEVAIKLNGEKFFFRVEKFRGFECVYLVAERFVPEKYYPLLISPVPAATDFRYPGLYENSKFSQDILEIKQSQDGEVFSIGLVTNSEHSCLGSNDIRYIHLKKSELKNICINMLR